MKSVTFCKVYGELFSTTGIWINWSVNAMVRVGSFLVEIKRIYLDFPIKDIPVWCRYYVVIYEWIDTLFNYRYWIRVANRISFSRQYSIHHRRDLYFLGLKTTGEEVSRLWRFNKFHRFEFIHLLLFKLAHSWNFLVRRALYGLRVRWVEV